MPLVRAFDLAVPDDWSILAFRVRCDSTAMAQVFGVTGRHLRRVCQDRFQLCFGEWLAIRRLNTAVHLLRVTDCVKTAAYDAGYKRLPTFTEHFRRYHGITPCEHLQWIRRQRRIFLHDHADPSPSLKTQRDDPDR